MKKEISPVAIVGVIVAVVAVAIFVVLRAGTGDASSAPSDMGQQLNKILTRTGGDTNKMTAEERKTYNKAVESGYYRPSGNSGHTSSSGRPLVPEYSNNNRGYPAGMSASPGAAGGYGSSGSSSSSGSSGGYPR